MVGGVSGHSPQPAVMVAGATQAIVTQVGQMSVVDTTAAQPEIDSIEAEPRSCERADPALGGAC
jgi:hypothetical protein